MVYMPPDALGWLPLARSWVQALPLDASPRDNTMDAGSLLDSVSSNNCSCQVDDGAPYVETSKPLQPVQAFLLSLFEAFAPPLLAWVRANGREAVPGVDAARVAAVTTLLGRLLQTDGWVSGGTCVASGRLWFAWWPGRLRFMVAACSLTASTTQPSRPIQNLPLPAACSRWCLAPGPLPDAARVALQYMFAFSLVWGGGGGLDAARWDGFDKAARALLDGTANYPAGAGTVFDYRLDAEWWVAAGLLRGMRQGRGRGGFWGVKQLGAAVALPMFPAPRNSAMTQSCDQTHNYAQLRVREMGGLAAALLVRSCRRLFVPVGANGGYRPLRVARLSLPVSRRARAACGRRGRRQDRACCGAAGGTGDSGRGRRRRGRGPQAARFGAADVLFRDRRRDGAGATQPKADQALGAVSRLSGQSRTVQETVREASMAAAGVNRLLPCLLAAVLQTCPLKPLPAGWSPWNPAAA